MGWVGVGGVTNNIGGAFELSLAEDSTTQTERLQNNSQMFPNGPKWLPNGPKWLPKDLKWLLNGSK